MVHNIERAKAHLQTLVKSLVEQAHGPTGQHFLDRADAQAAARRLPAIQANAVMDLFHAAADTGERVGVADLKAVGQRALEALDQVNSDGDAYLTVEEQASLPAAALPALVWNQGGQRLGSRTTSEVREALRAAVPLTGEAHQRATRILAPFELPRVFTLEGWDAMGKDIATRYGGEGVEVHGPEVFRVDDSGERNLGYVARYVVTRAGRPEQERLAFGLANDMIGSRDLVPVYSERQTELRDEVSRALKSAQLEMLMPISHAGEHIMSTHPPDILEVREGLEVAAAMPFVRLNGTWLEALAPSFRPAVAIDASTLRDEFKTEELVGGGRRSEYRDPRTGERHRRYELPGQPERWFTATYTAT